MFPFNTKFGNSAQVVGEKMGGDADDYVLSKYGIPSVTAELGFDESFFKTWVCKDEKECFKILS